ATDDPTLRREAARSGRRLGDILAMLGEYDKAEKSYRHSLELLSGDTEAEHDIGETWNNLGNLLKDTGKTAKAAEAYARAIAIRETLLAERKNDADYRRELANTLYNRGLLRQTLGEGKEAKADYARALALQRQLPDAKQEESRTCISLGGLLASSEPAEAEK